MSEPKNNPAASPFPDEWPDEKVRQRFLTHARESYENTRQFKKVVMQGHFDYGKWLIATMVAINGGALYAVANMHQRLSQASQIELVAAAGWLIASIVFIMLAGFLAWLNFQILDHQTERWLDPAHLYRRDVWTQNQLEVAGRRTDGVNATLYGAAASGLLSAFCFLAGAIGVVGALRTGG